MLTRIDRGRHIVAHACGVARAAGVTIGMDVAHARALLPTGNDRSNSGGEDNGGVRIEPHDPQRDAAALHALARWAVRFTPVVAPDPPDGLLLDIAGCQRLYGGEAPLLRRVTDAIASLGFTARAAIAPSVGGAWAIARYGVDRAIIDTPAQLCDALAGLPVCALRLDTPVAVALAEIAIERIGDLYALPRRSLATRFGGDVLLRLDQALGRAFEPVDAVQPPDPVRVTRAFDGPVVNLEGVMLTVRQLTVDLHAELARREAGARRIDLTLDRIDTDTITHTVTLSRPTRDASHVWALLRPIAERAHLGHGVERITLAATHTARLTHQQARLDGGDDGDGDGDGDGNARGTQRNGPRLDKHVGRLVDHITSRLGPQRVRRVLPEPTHVPESAFVSRPIEQHVEPHTSHASHDTHDTRVVDADRPSRVYRRPRPVRVILMAPDGPVMSMQHDNRRDHRADDDTRIVTTIGPERITTPWWADAHDRAAMPVTRDYYKLQDATGRWWWAFREIETGRWFIHGRWS